MLDPVALREHSRATVRELGFPDPPVHLPILWEVDEGYSNRPLAEVVERLAALNIVVARSFGMPVGLASDWLDANDIRRVLTEAEEAVIAGDDSRTVEIEAEVEAMPSHGHLGWHISSMQRARARTISWVASRT